MDKLKMELEQFCEELDADNMEYEDGNSITSTPIITSPQIEHYNTNNNSNKDLDYNRMCHYMKEEEIRSQSESSSQKRTTYSYGSDGGDGLRLMKVATRKNETKSNDKFSRKRSFSSFPSWCQPSTFSISQTQNQSPGRGLKRNQSCILKTEEQNEKRQRVEKLTETIQRYSSFGPISSTTNTISSQESNYTNLYHEDFQVSSESFDD